jgi:hypothetical protein
MEKWNPRLKVKIRMFPLDLSSWKQAAGTDKAKAETEAGGEIVSARRSMRRRFRHFTLLLSETG